MFQTDFFKNRRSRITRVKIMLTVEQIREAYTKAVSEGSNIAELAEKLGVKLATLNQSLTSIRKNLRDAGIAEEEIKEIFPPLIRRTGPRSSGRSVAIAKMVAEAKAAAEAKALAKLETATAPE
jgi:DNA-binding MarR family transcriptional regulator